MKRLILSALAAVLCMHMNAQMFNTGTTLKRNSFSLGLEPVIFIGGPSDGFNMFFHGGYGLTSGIDLGLKFGAGNTTYFGADVEWALGRRASLTTGVHDFGNFGLDLAFNITFPLTSSARIFTGLDMDFIFPENNDVVVPVWLPIGVEIGLRKNLAFILEAEVGLNNPAWHVIGGGVVFYF